MSGIRRRLARLEASVCAGAGLTMAMGSLNADGTVRRLVVSGPAPDWSWRDVPPDTPLDARTDVK